LLPEAHSRQKAQADLRPEYQINQTAFSTVTINRNFRTGIHKDAGDYPTGFGNLVVIERGDYSGGYTCFPEFGVGFDVRTGDMLLMDVHQFHANTAMYETPKQAAYNETLPKIYNLKSKVIKAAGADKNYTRLSFVCYLRNKLKDCTKIETPVSEIPQENAIFEYQ
jgi:hypothetical protein